MQTSATRTYARRNGVVANAMHSDKDQQDGLSAWERVVVLYEARGEDAEISLGLP